MSASTLVVRHYGRHVGTITRAASGGLCFAYAPSWLEADKSFALATELPLREGQVETSYFANLLPEARARARICRMAGISVDNDFAFLRAFGADCAGSLSITDPAETPALADDDDYLLLSDDDGARLATSGGFANFFRPGGRVRLSLAGAQNKLAVVKLGDELAVPLNGRPSTHVLKLPSAEFKGLVENEAIVLSMARALGLPVVEHTVVRLGGVPMLLVTRYDRELRGDEVLRLHQQDMCQASGLPPDIKYESEGGLSLRRVFERVRAEVDDPLTASNALVRWVVFNVLVHNADAHAKNVSMLRTQDESQTLAPFYDLVCTGAYELDHTMAMAIGGQFDPGALARASWIRLAADIDVGVSLVLRTLQEMAERVPDVLSEELAQLQNELGRVPRRQQLERTIRRRSKKAIALLAS
ncbi:MAG: type II toxin-antitoxin system HipA family toxin [Deltaproteobacteria bacterium]|nr:type II toxin-antitoxin system HipA family toxin [Deltaproteobacteria bacterium]